MAKRGPRANNASNQPVNGPRVLIFGTSGQLGSALFGNYARAGQLERVIPKTRATVDVNDHDRVYDVIRGLRPDVVINAAGLTVPAQARNNHKQAWLVNAAAVGNMAKACAIQRVAFIQLSSADVFGADTQSGPYAEPDTVHGASTLAQTHIAAEHAVMSVPLSGGNNELLRSFKWYVLRLSELFAPVSVYYPSLLRLFYDRLVKSRAQLALPTDVVRSFSFTPVMSRHIRWLADNTDKVESGTYHLTSSDSGSLYQVGKEIASRLPGHHAELVETRRDDYATAQGLAAPEIPRNTALAMAKWKSVCPVPMPDWRTAVRAFVSGDELEGQEDF